MRSYFLWWPCVIRVLSEYDCFCRLVMIRRDDVLVVRKYSTIGPRPQCGSRVRCKIDKTRASCRCEASESEGKPQGRAVL